MCYSGLMAGLVVGIIVFLLGLCLGSFLNVVVYRLNHQLSPLRGRSFCPKCKKKILWQDNLPLLSFLLLKGRCRSCHSPISWQYPLVELATGLVTFLIVFYFSLPLVNILYLLLVSYALIVIAASDFLYQTIPDEAVYFGIVLALSYSFLVSHDLTSILSGLGASLFFLLLAVATRGKGMGMGDVKLVGFLGLFLGFPQILVALFLAFLTGAVFGVILILVGKKRLGEHLAFGPFLASTAWLSWFWGQKIWELYLGKFLI